LICSTEYIGRSLHASGSRSFGIAEPLARSS